ncbi:MAG: zinc ABC transporter substrate-binding protein [Myxococcales bacterium]|nr:zinc ABC transporter substrate-binding protein [Myxococcales bacterium]
MQRIVIALCLALATLGFPRLARADLEVVATVPTLAAIAKSIGGEHVSVTSLALPTQDPHFVDAKPSLAIKLNKADLLLVVGLQLEMGWLPPLQTGARNSKIQVGAEGYLDCSLVAKLMGVPTNVDRSQGDIHPGGNPHYLYDPRQIEQVAVAIAGRMSELDGDQATSYKQNLKAFLKKLHSLRQKLEKKLAPHRGATVIGYHRSWIYVADWLGLEQVAFLEPKPGIPPNPGHVAKVLVKARQAKVKAILEETYYPDTTAKLVAEKSGAKLVTLAGGVDFAGGEDVFGYLTKLADALDRGLSR